MTSDRPSYDSTRREFLLGKSALRSVQNAVPEAATPEETDGSPERYLVQVGRSAMACDFEFYLNAGQHPGSTEAAVAALDLIDRLETQLTVYRATSEVISINQLAAQSPVPVEARLFALLQRAVELHGETQGAFDITSGPLSRAWGFFRRSGRFPEPSEIAAARSRIGSQWLQLDDQARTVRFQHPELEINLNAIGKGYALDRSAELLLERGVTDFLVHGGQSSLLARGCRSDQQSASRGWLVAIKHPFRPEQRLKELWLQDQALGTSGAGNQFFHFQGKRYGHVIDPRTGWPADRVLSATVVAADAATADALATALFVMGVDESAAYCDRHPEIGALLVKAGQRAGELEMHSFNLADDRSPDPGHLA